MDFITDLPLSRSSNGVFAIVDKLNKWVKLIPMVVGEGELSTSTVVHYFSATLCIVLGFHTWCYMTRTTILLCSFELCFGSYWSLGFLYPPPTTLVLTGRWRGCTILWLGVEVYVVTA